MSFYYDHESQRKDLDIPDARCFIAENLLTNEECDYFIKQGDHYINFYIKINYIFEIIKKISKLL